MRFAQPQMLYLLLLLPPLALVAFWFRGRGRKALRAFAGGHDLLALHAREVGVHRRAVKAILLLAAALFAILAAARPQAGSRLEPVTRQGVDVAVVLDTSLSMAAADVSPNRLELARHSAVSLIRSLSGNRVALVTFAGEATVACPLTLDSEAALLFLDTVDLEAVPVPGTALAEALSRAAGLFRSDPASEQEGRGRAVVLYTDGEEHEEGLDEAIDDLKRMGVPVYAVGLGTVRGGPIPLGSGSNPSEGYKKDRQGRVVTTRLSEEVLEKVGLGTGGRYYRSTPAELEIDEIVEAISGMDATEFGSVMRVRYEERFQIPLGLALLALLAEVMISDRRRAAA